MTQLNQMLFSKKNLQNFKIIILFVLLLSSCSHKKTKYIVPKKVFNDTIVKVINSDTIRKNYIFNEKKIKVAAERIDYYLPIIRNKRIGLVVNQTSVVNNIHLVDFLLSKNINIVKNEPSSTKSCVNPFVLLIK